MRLAGFLNQQFLRRVCEWKRWAVQITYENKQHHLGSSDTKQAAAPAYTRQAIHFGKNSERRITEKPKKSNAGSNCLFGSFWVLHSSTSI
jgi:hypothetical protein